MSKKRILFLGETYRADAITWMNGLKEFGDFEIVTFELKTNNNGLSRIKRLFEFVNVIFSIKKIAKKHNPDMVIAERTTSYGFLAAISGITPIAIAQQGISDLWPYHSAFYWVKKMLQDYAFKKADLLHAWGDVMAQHMKESGVDMTKVMQLPKGVNLDLFEFNQVEDYSVIQAIVTRSLQPEYKHDTILKAFSILKQKNIPFKLTIVGDGQERNRLLQLATALNISLEVDFVGRIDYKDIPKYLKKANIYVSMPVTEGVSASLFEAMACGCYPIVSDLPGNRSWISEKINGTLVPIENHIILAKELEWAYHNSDFTKKSIAENRKLVEECANYKTNMKKIADAYHDLMTIKSTTT